MAVTPSVPQPQAAGTSRPPVDARPGASLRAPGSQDHIPAMPGMPGGGADMGFKAMLTRPVEGAGANAGMGRLLQGSARQAKPESGLKSFLKGVVFGSKDEQRPDRDTLPVVKDALRSSLKRAEGQLQHLVHPHAPVPPASGSPATQAGVPPEQRPPGLFDAMDAPLHGLTPDDIQFADEVDAALARRPRIGARMLSVSVAALFVAMIFWAGLADIDEVTHAEGQVVGSQRTQTIQNLEGGILRGVLVHEGQIVEKGTVLAQLDNEMAESAYRDAQGKAMENSLAILRLESELKDEKPRFPDDLKTWASQLMGREVEPSTLARAAQIVQDQEQTWESRQEKLKAEIDVLKSQYEQRTHDVEEQAAHKAQLDQSLALAIEQQDAAHALVLRNNFSRMEYLGLQQKVVELQGQINMLAASIPRSQAAANESLQRIASRKAEQNAAVTDEINKRRLELSSLRESLAAGSDRVTRTELRSPVRGTVKQIYINTVGGVVKPGEPIMDVVPLDDTLLVEARVTPKDVAFLRPGQHVMVKVSAYDFSIYGGLEGALESISADTIEDKRGNYYYLVKVRTRKTSIVYHNEALPIIPGMMVTADILIGKKTVLDYLLKPILKAKQNALRER